MAIRGAGPRRAGALHPRHLCALRGWQHDSTISALSLSLASPCPRAAILEQSLNLLRTRLCSKKRPGPAADPEPAPEPVPSHTTSACISLLTLPSTSAPCLVSSCQLEPTSDFPYAAQDSRVPPHPHDQVLILQQSPKVQLSRPCSPGEPSFAAGVYLSNPLSLDCFPFHMVRPRRGQRIAFRSQLAPTLWVPMMQL